MIQRFAVHVQPQSLEDLSMKKTLVLTERCKRSAAMKT